MTDYMNAIIEFDKNVTDLGMDDADKIIEAFEGWSASVAVSSWGRIEVTVTHEHPYVEMEDLLSDVFHTAKQIGLDVLTVNIMPTSEYDRRIAAGWSNNAS